jgi:hypothetical protein
MAPPCRAQEGRTQEGPSITAFHENYSIREIGPEKRPHAEHAKTSQPSADSLIRGSSPVLGVHHPRNLGFAVDTLMHPTIRRMKRTAA